MRSSKILRSKVVLANVASCWLISIWNALLTTRIDNSCVADSNSSTLSWTSLGRSMELLDLAKRFSTLHSRLDICHWSWTTRERRLGAVCTICVLSFYGLDVVQSIDLDKNRLVATWPSGCTGIDKSKGWQALLIVHKMIVVHNRPCSFHRQLMHYKISEQYIHSPVTGTVEEI